MPLFRIHPYESTERDHAVKCKIYDCRKGYKWTLKELALRSGVPFSTLWRLERGQGTTLTNAYKVASAFQLTIYELWRIPQSGAAIGLHRKNLYSVRELRLQRSWRLHDLAELSGVSKTTLCQIEKGHMPSLKNAVRIAAALDLSVYQIWKP
jgi:transcriptional regulator with XRE-family HTH domain